MIRARSETPLAGDQIRDAFYQWGRAVLPVSGRFRGSNGGLSETICKIRFDAPPGEDAAGRLWAIRGGAFEAAGEEAGHVPLPRLHAPGAHSQAEKILGRF